MGELKVVLCGLAGSERVSVWWWEVGREGSRPLVKK